MAILNKKNLMIVIALIGLIGWGIYDTSLSLSIKTEKSSEVKEAATTSKNLEIGLQEGNKAPNFGLKTLDGQEVKLSDMVGKKVILNFWATWCPPCKAEMPHMQEFYEKQKNNQVTILAVNLTTSEKSSDNIGAFVKDYGLTFPIVLDSEGQVGQTYQDVTIPTSYIIDTKGVIRKKIVGPMDKEMMTELLQSVD
ncbi:redoxin domain-containing protein [Neobacillus sp. PS2-9]|uniref:redoxin domain-containing protein n=1 Tax=Neobacillus sp. PS2-9 TaxID=3070676 RepID=UPI0027DF6A4A|nr:redoxin domain-containing protein [Neobacillus sp. PS2-9]WML60508.1 redoxin domain-containing protein [Neobacillus sp. PS2-9]